MDNPFATFDWNRARAFLTTAEEGSLSAAARVLGLTQPTLGRQVSALEEELGVVLFERVGKGLVLTPVGRELLDHARGMQDAAGRMSIAAAGQSQSIEGRITITASEVMSAHVLPPALTRLRQAAPRLEIDVLASDSLQDLQRREADIAIRHVRPEQPELIARLVREPTASLYASEAYLARRGRPASIEDLASHDFINFGDTEVMLGFLRPLGLPVTKDNLRVGSSSGVSAWAMVQHGLGISIMSDDVAGATLGVERLLPGQLEPVRFPIWLTTHRELHTARRIRLVFDLLADFLSKPQS